MHLWFRRKNYLSRTNRIVTDLAFVPPPSLFYKSYVELTQTMTSAHDVLYPSKDRTIALVKVGEYYKYASSQMNVHARAENLILPCASFSRYIDEFTRSESGPAMSESSR